MTHITVMTWRSINGMGYHCINYFYLVAASRKITPHFIKVSTLGFISSCLDFTKAVKIAAMPDTLKHKIVASAVKSSFGIYCTRNAAALDAP